MILPSGIIVLNKIDFFNSFEEILAFFKFVSIKFVFVKSEPNKFEYHRLALFMSVELKFAPLRSDTTRNAP